MDDSQFAAVERIHSEVDRLGLDLVGIASATPPATVDQYRRWLERGYHGEMAYLARSDAVAKRADLNQILPGVRSVVLVCAQYHTVPLPDKLRDDPSRGIVASYAWGDDYHEVLAPRLRQLADSLEAHLEAESAGTAAFRVYVDTGPVLERDLGTRARLGFVGKNTNLIHPSFGSWFFLGEVLTTAEIPAEAPADEFGTCGRCTRCLDACPTGALVAPYVLDARRCISYLTIELKGSIPHELRRLMGNRIFGCDICQEVCPWNRRFARPTAEVAFQPRPDTMAPHLLDLLALDDAGFRQRFRDSPIKRAKRRGLLRNAAVALGNWGDPSAVPGLVRGIEDPEPLIRGHVAWALGQIGTMDSHRVLEKALGRETEAWVQAEIQLGLGMAAQASVP